MRIKSLLAWITISRTVSKHALFSFQCATHAHGRRKGSPQYTHVCDSRLLGTRWDEGSGITKEHDAVARRDLSSALINDNSLGVHYEQGNLTILDRNGDYLVVSKPPAVLCHHSFFTGSRAAKEAPLLQRTREAVGRRVNLIHRLDRGCSGCVLMAYADSSSSKNVTAALSHAMGLPSTRKTYVALVRGEGIFRGRDFRQEGWFSVNRPIKNERGQLNNATTWFRFVVGQDDGRGRLKHSRPRASLVLARPETGRWHQIRRHLNGLSHPILGDSSHGNSRTNREWREHHSLLPARTCLHLARLQMEPCWACPNGIDVADPLAPDMLGLIREWLPDLLEQAEPVLEQEGVLLKPRSRDATVLPYLVPLSK